MVISLRNVHVFWFTAGPCSQIGVVLIVATQIKAVQSVSSSVVVVFIGIFLWFRVALPCCWRTAKRQILQNGQNLSPWDWDILTFSPLCWPSSKNTWSYMSHNATGSPCRKYPHFLTLCPQFVTVKNISPNLQIQDTPNEVTMTSINGVNFSDFKKQPWKPLYKVFTCWLLVT